MATRELVALPTGWSQIRLTNGQVGCMSDNAAVVPYGKQYFICPAVNYTLVISERLQGVLFNDVTAAIMAAELTWAGEVDG